MFPGATFAFLADCHLSGCHLADCDIIISITISKFNPLRQLYEGDVVGQRARIPVRVNNGLGGFDDDAVSLRAQREVVTSGIDLPTWKKKYFNFFVEKNNWQGMEEFEEGVSYQDRGLPWSFGTELSVNWSPDGRTNSSIKVMHYLFICKTLNLNKCKMSVYHRDHRKSTGEILYRYEFIT